jgi:hypothetical protein
MGRLPLVRTEKTRGRATATQQYFWYTHVADRDPWIICLPLKIRMTGPLDRRAIVLALESFVAAHEVYRTTFEQVGSQLHQVVIPREAVVPFHVDTVDKTSEDEAQWALDVEAVVQEFMASTFDVEHGEQIRARLIIHAPEVHTLLLVLHHLVFDENSLRTIPAEIFARYDVFRAGGTPKPPALQYLDYSEALFAWLDREGRTYWEPFLADLPPLDLPLDTPRDELVALRDAAPCGIVAEPMHHPYHGVIATPEDKARYAAFAESLGTTTGIVHLAAYAWLLHKVSGQDDICIEDVYAPWKPQRAELDQLHGLCSTWALTRIRIPRGATFREVIQTTARVMAEADAHGPIVEYYERVPHHARRASMQNYGPAAPLFAGKPEVSPGLFAQYVAAVVPVWRKPWEHHLSLMDNAGLTKHIWTGSTRLYRRETILAMCDRFFELLHAELPR